ncbi:unnamed protein product, partial [marine sediment metagenome]
LKSNDNPEKIKKLKIKKLNLFDQFYVTLIYASNSSGSIDTWLNK